MNKNKKTLSIVERAKKSFVGRIVCRLAGEEKGAVMMEYVIVAVMIAAAVALGAYFFGETILDMFGVAAKGTDGRHDEARRELVDTVRPADDGRKEAAENNQKDFSDKGRSVSGGSGSSSN